MPAISEILLDTRTHPGFNTDPVTYYGEAFKGDGYYGLGDGVHTVEIQISGFTGSILIQASLASSPTGSDWFSIPLTLAGSETLVIDTTGAISKINVPQIIQYTTATTSVKVYNFTGNFVWVRAIVENWTSGAINRILYNH